MALLEFTEKGIYCPSGDFYIDPWGRVKKALITHAHSDHARSGHTQYIATKDSVPILKHRLGSFIQILGVDYHEVIHINGVRVTFHPAGHIIGSAQIRIENKGEVWVVSGDYKLENDGISVPFEPVKCHTFITESTFGLPSFKWKPQESVYDEINAWWKSNTEKGRASVIAVYSLGKAQRIIQNIDPSIGAVYTHGAIENTHDVLRKQGIKILNGLKVENKLLPDQFKNAMIIAPPSVTGSAWTTKFGEYEEAMVSGWMAIRGIRKRRNAERGFILSDHADWEALNLAVHETGAENIFVTHGYSEIFSKWLTEKGLNAKVVPSQFTGDDDTEPNQSSEIPT